MTSTLSAAATGERRYHYYDFIMASFVTILLCSNLIGVTKVCTLDGIKFSAAVLFFPISYVFGDILTEVYGYARSRKVVWAGFAALGFASFMCWLVLALPSAPSWPHEDALITVFGSTPRIVAASLAAYFVGEFANSYVLAKMKILTKGKWLWTRTVGSTVVGELVDSVVFYPLAFLGIWRTETVFEVLVSNYLIKVLWEVLMTPVTYKIVGFLKRAEGVDFYDYHTHFTPFSLKD